MAIYVVARTTPGVRRNQLIQTATDRLTVRREVDTPGDDGAVWAALHQRMRAYLTSQGLPTVMIERAAEPPASDPQSGKVRRVWSAVRR
jgi:phenylacetate-CoA ligase